MKILLIGEFSALHNNLKDGLIELGHDVHIAALGDGWKNIPRDIDLDSSKTRFIAVLERRLNVFIKLWNLKNYDVVQLINPFCLFYIPFFSKMLIKRLKKNNGKLFLIAAGTDSFYLKYGRERLIYSPIPDYLKYDLKKKRHKYERKHYFSFNNWVADTVDGIIPVMHEYEICYSDKCNCLQSIPIPMNTKKISYEVNDPDGNLFIFHGLNRYGFKGTKYVEEAFDKLKATNLANLTLLIEGKMPLDQYLTVMKQANVIIDQTSSYSLGVNALYAMAMGKVVLGGAEPEAFKSLNYTWCPVLNIRPDSESIVKQIKYLMQNPIEFQEISKDSRRFIEEYHEHIKVARQYVRAWSE